jgi:hypothetical protein
VEHKPEQAHPRLGSPELPEINCSIFGPDNNAKLLQYSSALLQDLAGNAFHIGCASAMLLSMFCSVGEAVREKDSPALPDSVKHLACSTLSSHESEQMSAVDADIALDALWT